MSIRFSLLVVALGAALSASPAQAQVRMPTHVACVGDSITYGYMASSASASYPSVLQTLFGSSVQVMNYGHNSATMLSVGDLPYQTLTEYTAATTFVSGAGSTAVVDVIIMLGTNDSKSYNWMVGDRHARPAVRHRLRRHGRSLRVAADPPARLPGVPAARLRQHVRDQRNDHPRSDPAAHPAGGDGRRGCRSSTSTRRRRRFRISSRTASTRTTPGTRWSRR